MTARTLILLSLFILPACNWRNSEDRALERPAFVSLYADLTATLWKTRRATADSVVLGRVADSVLAANGVSRRRYEATWRWYNADPERWKSFFDEVGKVLDERAKQEASHR